MCFQRAYLDLALTDLIKMIELDDQRCGETSYLRSCFWIGAIRLARYGKDAPLQGSVAAIHERAQQLRLIEDAHQLLAHHLDLLCASAH